MNSVTLTLLFFTSFHLSARCNSQNDRNRERTALAIGSNQDVHQSLRDASLMFSNRGKSPAIPTATTALNSPLDLSPSSSSSFTSARQQASSIKPSNRPSASTTPSSRNPSNFDFDQSPPIRRKGEQGDPLLTTTPQPLNTRPLNFASSSSQTVPEAQPVYQPAESTTTGQQDHAVRKNDKKKGTAQGSRGNETMHGSWFDRLTTVGDDTPGSCGGTVFLTTLPTTIRSPGWEYNQKYPPNSNCVWNFVGLGSTSDKSDAPPAIKLRVKHLELEDDIECRYDFLDLNGMRKLCGLIIDKEIFINVSTAQFVFRTDNNYGFKGFDIEVSHHYEGCTPKISAQMGTEGYITSPMFPNNFPDGVDCWTVIRAESKEGVPLENVTITIQFEFVDMEPDEKCAYDYVEVHDGLNRTTGTARNSLGRYCEYNVLPVDNSKDDRIDGSRPDTGWSVPPLSGFQSGPYGSTQSGNRDIYTRGTQAPKAWTVRMPSETTLSDRLSSGYPSGSRSWSETARSLADTSYTRTQTPLPELSLTSTSNELLIHFHSDQILNSRGYRAKYSVESNDRQLDTMCDWVYDEKNKIIKTPNFPNNYPPNMDCTIAIQAPTRDDKIVIVFESFRFETDQNCSFDRIEIYDEFFVTPVTGSSATNDNNKDKNDEEEVAGNSRTVGNNKKRPIARLPVKPVRVYCGHKPARFKYVSKGHIMKIRFVSDNAGEFEGFSARYAFVRDKSSLPDAVINQQERGEFESYPINATVTAGASHRLSCRPWDKESNESIIWFKDEKVVDSGTYDNNTELLIREFTTADIGRYVCKWGDHVKDAFLFMQQPACSIIFLKRPRDLVHSEGEDAILECHAVSSPPSNNKKNLHITWLKDNVLISENTTKYEILRSGYLVVNGLNRKDSGFYTCRATSTSDTDCNLESTAKLRVNVRVNIEEVCGRPKKGNPARGKPNIDNGKIVGGADAQRGAFPWQVMFWDYKRRSFCGGALLNERWIVTAAHCFDHSKYPNAAPPPAEVRLGRYDQSAPDEETQFVTKIAEIIKHPEFSKETFDNDIALVRVTDHIPLGDFISPICLEKNSAVMEDVFFRSKTLKMGHVTGWGLLKEGGPQPKFLQELRLPIVNQDTCIRSTQFPVSRNMFCAGYAQEIVGDACKGDSGGPFVGQHEDRWYLLGIVSWGEGCGRAGKYGFYTKVSNYADWIRAFIKL